MYDFNIICLKVPKQCRKIAGCSDSKKKRKKRKIKPRLEKLKRIFMNKYFFTYVELTSFAIFLETEFAHVLISHQTLTKDI